MMTLFLFGWGLSSTVPTTADVLDIMSRIPPECAFYSSKCAMTPAGFDKIGDAKEVASAIAEGVRGEQDPWGRASIASVFAAYEAGNQKCAEGDSGKSLGVFQMKGIPRNIACSPRLEFPLWLSLVRYSESRCSDNDPDERLALLASGRCDRGRRKVRNRSILSKLLTED
jgi:hypothetical protein